MSDGSAPTFQHRLRVRYGECDPQGVVFNAHYFSYFDVAMTEFHREVIGRYSELSDSGVEMVVAEARARYHAPARFDDEIDVAVAPRRVGNTSLTVELAVSRAGELLVEGELRYVFVDAASKTKRPIPPDVRQALEPLVARADAA